MAKARAMDEPNVSDDSISLTSTIASDKEEFYEVECILAERNSKGVMEYLTAWKGYPETAHEWIPRSNFQEDDVFNQWNDTQKRVADGLERPFDTKTWRKRCKAIGLETRRRKERRRAKRLRLSMSGDLTSGRRVQDGNNQTSGSDSTPKRSDKRIKRRSVHQDSPPSSSTSAPVSSSSEDSDRPLVSRQDLETFTPISKWTQAETIVFEEGLRTVKGPRWREILSLYGRNGKINQALQHKNPGDLYEKAKLLRQEFVDSGREPPDYLEPFSEQASSKGSRTSTLNVRSESKNQSRAVSKKSSRSASMDSMTAGLQKKMRIHEAKNQEKSRPQQSTSNNSRKMPEPVPEQEKGSRAAKTSQAPAPNAEVAHANGTLNETPQAAQSNLHPKEAAPDTQAIMESKGSKNYHHEHSRFEYGPHAKNPSQVSDVPHVGRQTESQAPRAKEIAKPAASATAQPDFSHRDILETNEATPGEISRTTWSGTARSHPLISNQPRQGAVKDVSTRPSSLKLKPKLGQIEPKKPNVTRDVTAAWNAEPKKQRSNSWATKNTDSVNNQPTKRNYKLSVQNRIFKSRRDGRPPDPSRLVFIDPKTGKAPTTVPAPSTAMMLPTTPLQLHQEELAAREAKEYQNQEGEDAMVISTSEPDPLPQVMEQNRETRDDEQKVLDTGRPISNISGSVRPARGEMTHGPANINYLVSSGPASSHPGPPLNEPPRPSIETKETSRMSLPDYIKRSMPSAQPLKEAVINSHLAYSLEQAPKITLKANPSEEDKNGLNQRLEHILVHGDIKLGQDDLERFRVKLVGFGFEVRKLLLTIKSSSGGVYFVFDSACLASEYQAYFPAEPSDYLGSGSIIPYAKSVSAIENIVESLANTLQGGLFFAQHYTMVMYPAGASAWAFLDKDLPSVHPGTILRFAVRKPLLPVPADVHKLATARVKKDDPELYTEITTRIQDHPILAKEKNINIVFRDMFDIDFDRLIAQNGDQQHLPTKIFFLCFIPQGCETYEPDPAKRLALRMRTSEEHDFFIKFLQANDVKEIYSMQKIGSQEIDSNGAWDYFCKNVKSGTIIFHDAYIRYDLVPRLAKHLLHGSVNVWKTSLSPMHPGEKHPHLVRLFPHGGVLLLTESLILYQPRESLRILMWFRRVYLPAKASGTWKLAMRPRIREWLLDLIEAYVDSGKDIFGCGVQIFADVYTEIYWLLQKPDVGANGLMCHEWDYEIPTDEAPIVTSTSLSVLQGRKEWKGELPDKIEPDDNNIRQNDDLLAQWFAEWAIANLHSYRKFHIILGYAHDHPFTDRAISAYERAWGHVEVMTFDEAFKRHKVTPQSELDVMEAERRRKLKEHLPARKAAALKARKEEREAAKAALDARMQVFRDAGATEEEVVRGGRQVLREELGGSEREIEECRVDMERVVVGDRWWEEEDEEKGGPVQNEETNMHDAMDTS